MGFPKRDVNCGELRKKDEGKEVVLNGWVATVRDLGGLIFVDLRDRYGVTQLVAEPESAPELAERAKALKSEYVIWAKGKVRERSNPNEEIPTGLIEIVLEDFGVLSEAQLPPFEIDDDAELTEEVRLKYRFLDLRRPSMQKNMRVRNELYQITHKYFADLDFIEIETPFFVKSTPEGARDFLSPSRINKGKFYALPQSPQIYKQLLMISGFDKYVQIVKCFRDEDFRSDRQPEFTQIDMEMSFVDEEDVIKVTEGLLSRLWKEILDVEVPAPFKRMTYKKAMERFGTDKPDARFSMELQNVSQVLEKSEFKVFSGAIKKGGNVVALKAEGCAEKYSRKIIDELTELAKKHGAKGLAWMKKIGGEVKSPIAKFLSEDEINGIMEKTEAKDGDLLLFAADSWKTAHTVLGALRLEIARRENIFDELKDKYSFVWVVDFPVFEYDEEIGGWAPMHHPFTAPQEGDLEKLESDPTNAKARAYDVVVNGSEIGGGSVRINKREIQLRALKALGFSEDEANEKFGFLLDALKYGAPPHAGIAFGLDRIAMILAGADNIRDVIAFPKTTRGLSLMDGSPSEADEKQLKQLGIALIKSENREQ